MPVDNLRSLFHLLFAAEAAPTLRRIAMRLYNRLLKKGERGVEVRVRLESPAPIGVNRIVSTTVAMTNLTSRCFLFCFFLFCCKCKLFILIYVHNYCVSFFKTPFKYICSKWVLNHPLNCSFKWSCTVNWVVALSSKCFFCSIREFYIDFLFS